MESIAKTQKRNTDVPVMTVGCKDMEAIITDCKVWAKEMSKVYQPDLIVFIAKSGFLFARPMAEAMGCDMAGIRASRPANGQKDRFQGIIKILPKRFILSILKSPLMYRFHDRNHEREIIAEDSYEKIRHNSYDKILIVDDSVDTGWTAKAVMDMVRKDFKTSEIKIAAYSVIEYSESLINVDFYRNHNAVILTATSRRSNEYEKFMQLYSAWNCDSKDLNISGGG